MGVGTAMMSNIPAFLSGAGILYEDAEAVLTFQTKPGDPSIKETASLALTVINSGQ